MRATSRPYSTAEAPSSSLRRLRMQKAAHVVKHVFLPSVSDHVGIAEDPTLTNDAESEAMLVSGEQPICASDRVAGGSKCGSAKAPYVRKDSLDGIVLCDSRPARIAVHDRLRAVRGTELLVDLGDVRLRGGLADEQLSARWQRHPGRRRAGAGPLSPAARAVAQVVTSGGASRRPGSAAVNDRGETSAWRAAATTSSAGASFATKAEAPASSAANSCSSPAYIVSTTIPTSGSPARNARTRSRPVPSGRRTSVTTTSGMWYASTVEPRRRSQPLPRP